MQGDVVSSSFWKLAVQRLRSIASTFEGQRLATSYGAGYVAMVGKVCAVAQGTVSRSAQGLAWGGTTGSLR